MEENVVCPIMKLFSFIGKKWNLLIIKSIAEGCLCFSDIEKRLKKISPRMLSNRLKELEKEGFIKAKLREKTKNKVLYCLSEKGESFSRNIKSLERWTKEWEKTTH